MRWELGFGPRKFHFYLKEFEVRHT